MRASRPRSPRWRRAPRGRGRNRTRSSFPVRPRPRPRPCRSRPRRLWWSGRPSRTSSVTPRKPTAPAPAIRSRALAGPGTTRTATPARLYLFNRSHPLAEDDLAPDAPLKARQKLYIPPAEILEARYPDQIPGAAPPAATPTVTVGASPARSPAAPAPTAGPRSYRVGASGELEYDIARNLLGDGNRWVEIYKLNPGWLPEKPIPAGTTLTLPADARLP